MKPTSPFFKTLFLITLIFSLTCAHVPPVKTISSSKNSFGQTLFVALDGVGYDLIQELKNEGHFHSFLKPLPFLSTFPSSTTLAFTGILQPSGIGKVPGYEARFFSKKENRVMGGTPFDFYKIQIPYKSYFDAFRHHIHEKIVMYGLPGVAGKQDLIRTEKAVFESDKKVIMTYIGGTDGMSHLKGRKRTKRFLIYLDQFLQKLQWHYYNHHGKPLRIVIYSDHGFHFDHLNSLSFTEIKTKFKAKGYALKKSLQGPKDVVTVPYGLLSAGIFYTNGDKKELAEILSHVKGIDLAFWPEKNKKEIFVINSKQEIAKFEYQGKNLFRYQKITGDPLNYNAFANVWRNSGAWLKLTYNHYYPDVGYRLFDSFFDLTQNPASILISTKENYQYGSTAAKFGTITKFGHKGTHGGIFRSTTQGVFLTNSGDEKTFPSALRYDELFDFVFRK